MYLGGRGGGRTSATFSYLSGGALLARVFLTAGHLGGSGGASGTFMYDSGGAVLGGGPLMIGHCGGSGSGGSAHVCCD